MREDMFKVIVERPRWGSRMRNKEGRQYRDSEEVPHKVGIKKGYRSRKYLNENLNPLRRWLESQVNRPWVKVYAELCANIDRRSTVQDHIFTHIEDFVERHTCLIDGEVCFIGRWAARGVEQVNGSTVLLYVHPVTGLLLRNHYRVSYAQKQRRQQVDAVAKLADKRRDLDDGAQLHRIDGIWYHVTLAALQQPQKKKDGAAESERVYYPKNWDAVRHQFVSRDPQGGDGTSGPQKMFGKRDVYAATKRQLSNAELKRYRLTNATDQDAEDSRRFFWSVLGRAALGWGCSVPATVGRLAACAQNSSTSAPDENARKLALPRRRPLQIWPNTIKGHRYHRREKHDVACHDLIGV